LLLKPEVRSVVMIIGHVFKEESLQMVLVQSNDVVEQIPSAAADPALSNTVLPRAPDGSLRGDDLHGSNRGWHFQSILCIVIKDEELGGRLLREGLSQLLGNSQRRADSGFLGARFIQREIVRSETSKPSMRSSP
jgi:hypothetical protein